MEPVRCDHAAYQTSGLFLPESSSMHKYVRCVVLQDWRSVTEHEATIHPDDAALIAQMHAMAAGLEPMTALKIRDSLYEHCRCA